MSLKKKKDIEKDKKNLTPTENKLMNKTENIILK